MKKNDTKSTVPGGVDEYIAGCPAYSQDKLKEIRSLIQEIAPNSTGTVSYFQMPGYSYDGYDYNGMFAWFSFKKPYVRLHIRPPVIQDHKEELSGYKTTKAIVSFPLDNDLPKELVKKLVQASLDIMKDGAK